MFQFKCQTCGELHQGVPSFGWDFPSQYLDIPPDERASRCELNSEACVIDGQWHFVRGCLEIDVLNSEEVFSWGVWVSLSDASFQQLVRQQAPRSAGPFFGWLCTHIWVYPDTLNLKTLVHIRDQGRRPLIELEPTDHPLAVEQRSGITAQRVAEIYAQIVHGQRPASMN
jgi:hypothetical protein